MSKEETKYIPTIPVRDIPKVRFEKVFSTEQEEKELKERLTKACANGNNRKVKYKITFYTNNGRMKVNTTIWSVGNSFITLKENIYIPIKSIINVI